MACAACHDEKTKLREEIDQLRAQLDPPGYIVQLQSLFGLTEYEAKILLSLLVHRHRSTGELMKSIYKDRTEHASGSLRVLLSRIRNKLGAQIDAIQGYGYKLADADKGRIMEML